jgi:hypothetical protein
MPSAFSASTAGGKSRVLVHVDNPGHGIAGGVQGLTEEAFGSGGIPLGGKQELDRLTG